eukprot:3192344-Rhodomonas_salina.1
MHIEDSESFKASTWKFNLKLNPTQALGPSQCKLSPPEPEPFAQRGLEPASDSTALAKSEACKTSLQHVLIMIIMMSQASACVSHGAHECNLSFLSPGP